MQGMIIHCGGYEATVDQVANVPTPAPTQTHYPVPHIEFYEQVLHRVKEAGLVIKEEQHALHSRVSAHDRQGPVIDGCNWFWLARVESERSDYDLLISARGSHGMYFKRMIGLGSWTTVCDNLLFSAEFVVGRKHTLNIRRDMPGMISRSVGSLMNERVNMDRRLEAYRSKPIGLEQADHLILEAAASRVIAASKILKVRDEFIEPSHEEHLNNGEHTVNTFVQAVTEVYKGSNVFTLPQRGHALHGIADSAVGLELLEAA